MLVAVETSATVHVTWQRLHTQLLQVNLQLLPKTSSIVYPIKEF